MTAKNMSPRLWWEREDLGYRKGRLFLGNRDLSEFAQSAGTPVYLYNSVRIKENLTRLAQARGDVRGLRLYVVQDNAAAIATYGKVGMERTAYRLYECEWVQEDRTQETVRG